MKIAIFFTYDYSVKKLKDVGILERELKVYQELNKSFGVKFTFFTYDEKIPSYLNKKNDFEFIPIYKYLKKSENKLLRFLKSFLIPFKIKNLLDDIDLLYQHQILGSWIPLVLKRLINKPVQIRTGYDAYLFSIENNEKLIIKYFYKQLTRISLKNSDLYTVTSKCDQVFLESQFNTKDIKVVPNWVEINDQKKIRKFEDSLLMIGRLEKQKNYPMAFNFIESINDDIGLHIYGNGNEKDKLTSLAKSLNSEIKFLGNTTHQKILQELSKYKFFLTTSSYEGNPKTVLEALANQCIVFASNIPNHTEIIIDGYNGFIFTDLDDLIYKFNEIKNNNDLVRKINENSLKSLKNNELKAVVENMYSDYKSLISLR